MKINSELYDVRRVYIEYLDKLGFNNIDVIVALDKNERLFPIYAYFNRYIVPLSLGVCVEYIML